MSEKAILRLRFEVVLDPEIIISKEDLNSEYKGDWVKVIQEMYDSEGQFWDEEMQLVEVKYIKDQNEKTSN